MLDRLAALDEAAAELAAIQADATGRIAEATAERDRLAAEAGGIPHRSGPYPGCPEGRLGWFFGKYYPHAVAPPPAVAAAERLMAALAEEAAPVGLALAQVDSERTTVRGELAQLEATITGLEAERDRLDAERAERARTIGHRLDWHIRVDAVLGRLGPGTAP